MKHATLLKSAATLLMLTAGAQAMAVVDLNDPSSYKMTVYDFTNWSGTSFTAFAVGDKVGTAWETGNGRYQDVFNVTTPAQLSGVLAFQAVTDNANGKGYWYRTDRNVVEMRNATRSACVQNLSAGDVVIFNTNGDIDFKGGGNGDGTWGEAVIDGNLKTITMLTDGNLGFCPAKASYIYSITVYRDAGALELPPETSSTSLEQYGADNADLATDAAADLEEVTFPEGGNKTYFHATDNIYLEKNGAWLLRTGKGKSNFKAQNGSADLVIAGLTENSYVGITAGHDKGNACFTAVTGGEFDRQIGQVYYYKATADGNMVIRVNSGGVWLQSIKEYVLPYTASLAVEASDGAYYSTFSAPFSTNVPEGITAYAATLSGSILMLTEVGDVVPANTGVILCADEADDYELTVAATDGIAPAQNDLLHTATVTTVSDGSVYALANIPAEAGVAFYQVEAGVVIPARKAYLQMGATSAPIRVTKDETAISNIADPQVTLGQLFDLQGRKHQGRKGLTIADGKVLFVK